MSDIEWLKKEVLTHFYNQKLIKFGKAAYKYFEAANLSNEETVEFFIELSKRNPAYFMEKIYSVTQFPNKLQSVEDIDKRNDYVLHKYILFKGEEILLQFYGSVYEKKTTSTGKIVLTNFRLISFGVQKTRSAQAKYVQTYGMTERLVRSAITKHRKKVQKSIMRSFHKDLKEWDLPEWGYYYPFYNVKKFKRGKKSISYTIEAETEKKTEKIQMTITPLRARNQSKVEFKQQQQALLDQLEQKLTENQ